LPKCGSSRGGVRPPDRLRLARDRPTVGSTASTLGRISRKTAPQYSQIWQNWRSASA
jgi:hypothetical protein